MTHEVLKRPIDPTMMAVGVSIFVLVLGLSIHVPGLVRKILNWRYIRSFEAIAARRARRGQQGAV